MKKKKQTEGGLPSLSLVFGYIAVKELKFNDRVSILDRLGYGNEEIATICDTTKGRVAVTKSYLKKKGRKK